MKYLTTAGTTILILWHITYVIYGYCCPSWPKYILNLNEAFLVK